MVLLLRIVVPFLKAWLTDTMEQTVFTSRLWVSHFMARKNESTTTWYPSVFLSHPVGHGKLRILPGDCIHPRQFATSTFAFVLKNRRWTNFVFSPWPLPVFEAMRKERTGLTVYRLLVNYPNFQPSTIRSPWTRLLKKTSMIYREN